MMFKKIFFPIICVIFLTISTSYAAPKPLVNIGNNPNTATANGQIPTLTKLTVGALAAGGIGYAIYDANRHHKHKSPPTSAGKIFLSAITDENTDELYYINQSALPITKWIPIGKRPAEVDYIDSFALSPDGNTIFISAHNKLTNTSQMYKVAANASRITNWVQIGNNPVEMGEIQGFVLSPDGNTIFMLDYNTSTNIYQIYKVAANVPTTTDWFQIGNSPGEITVFGFVLSPDGNTIFMDGLNCTTSTSQMYRVGASASKTTDWTQVGNRPLGMDEIWYFVLSPDGNTIFISALNDITDTSQMYRVGASASELTDWTQVGNRPLGTDMIWYFVLSPDGNTIFISAFKNIIYTSQIYQVAAYASPMDSWTQVGNRPTGVDFTWSFALSPDGNTIFMIGDHLSTYTSQMYRVGTSASKTTDWIQIGKRPTGVDRSWLFALSPDSNTIFMPGSNDTTHTSQMYKVDVSASNTTDWIQVGNRPANVNNVSSFILWPNSVNMATLSYLRRVVTSMFGKNDFATRYRDYFLGKRFYAARSQLINRLKESIRN